MRVQRASSRRWLAAGCAALCGSFLLGGTVVRAQESAPSDEISVLAYNIHGLFPWIAKDSPRDCILVPQRPTYAPFCFSAGSAGGVPTPIGPGGAPTWSSYPEPDRAGSRHRCRSVPLFAEQEL